MHSLDGLEVLGVVVVGVAGVVLVDDERVVAQDVSHAEVGDGEDHRVPHHHVAHGVEQLDPHQGLLLPRTLAQHGADVHALHAVPEESERTDGPVGGGGW